MDVNRSEDVVQQDDIRSAVDCTRKGDAGFLAAADIDAFLSDQGLVAVW